MTETTFLEQVETFFVSVVRRGLMLRPADIALAKDWEAMGVPIEVVRKGVAVGVAKFLEAAESHEPIPATLKYYRTFVEKEFEAYRRELARGVVRTGAETKRPDLRVRALEKVRDLRSRARSQAEAMALDKALMRLEAAGPGGAIVAIIDELEDALASAAIEAAPLDVRVRIESRIEAVKEAAKRQGIGIAAIADIVRAEMRAAATEAGFTSIIDTLL